MYLPRSLISQLYLDLVRKHHALSSPILILVALETDALCACRILTTLLKRDYVPHKIQPITGYRDLKRAVSELVRPMRLSDGGNGGVVACLGVGGTVDLQRILGLDSDDNEHGFDGVQIWIMDAMRPWNLSNVFGGYTVVQPDDQITSQAASPKIIGLDRGQIQPSYRSSHDGGIIVFDDGDIEEELSAEREAWYALENMPEFENDALGADSSVVEDEDNHTLSLASPSKKRKSWSDRGVEENEPESENGEENFRRRQRRRSNSSTSMTSSPSATRQYGAATQVRHDDVLVHSTFSPDQQSSPLPLEVQIPAGTSAQSLRRRLFRLRNKHTSTLDAYETMGTSYSSPVSTLMYSLASELGCEDNDVLWLAIIGLSSTELYGRTATGLSLTSHDESLRAAGWKNTRGLHIRQLLQDEVRRLNPPELSDSGREVNRGHATDTIPTHAHSPTDTSIRLSPEPRFLLVRHWSLYDSMLHSPYLSAKLHIWSDAGRRRLHKLLAKMGMSLTQCKQSYTHMDIELKKLLRERLLQFAPHYGLDGLIPPSSLDHGDREGWGFVRTWGWKACLSAADVAVIIGAILEVGHHITLPPASTVSGNACITTSQSSSISTTNVTSSVSSPSAHDRFYAAYDAVLSPSSLLHSIPYAQSLHRAILQTGTTLLQKRQVRHLRAFRMAVVKEGPDIALFTNPGALTKLALWIGEAVREIENDSGKVGVDGSMPLVLACIDENRGVYIVVGLGGGGGGESADRINNDQNKKEKVQAKQAKKEEREEKRMQRQNEKQEQKKVGEHAAGEHEEEYENETDEEYETSESVSESEDEGEQDINDEEESEAAKLVRKRGRGRNRFGNAFQEVIEETNARLQLDSFEHCVVEVKKEDLSGFLESLSMKALIT